MAVGLATITLDWSGEAEVEPIAFAVGLAQINADWSGEAEVAPSVDIPSQLATISATWDGEPLAVQTAVGVAGLATIGVTWLGEPESVIDSEVVLPDGFANTIRVSSASGAFGTVELVLPYFGQSDIDTLERRVTTTETLDGAYVYDGGFFEAGRTLTLALEDATLEVIQDAKRLLRIGQAFVSTWEGYYLCAVVRVEAPEQDLEIEFSVIERLTDDGGNVLN